MSKVYIVTDSTADIPKSLVEALGISVVPLKVHIQNETYLDRENLTADEFYHKLDGIEEFPTTSQPSPADFVKIYKRLANGEDAKIISIHLSSALSGTVQSALLAKTMVEDLGIEVAIVDSKKASYSIGIVVVAVAEAINNGMSFEDGVKLAARLSEETQVYFLVDSLDHLQKGGRIGKAASLFGSLLNIKPILSLNEQGEVFPVDKIRGRNKAMAKLIEYFTDYAEGKKINAGISHAANINDAKLFEQKLREHFDVQNIVITDIGPVIGTHVGQGTIAVMMFCTE